MVSARNNRFVRGAVLALLMTGAVHAEVPLSQAERRGVAVCDVVLDILAYTRWPRSHDSLRLCVAAPTEYADPLLGLRQLRDGRPMVTQRMGLDEPTLAAECDALYLGVLDDAARLRLATRLAGSAVLTLEENNRECVAGGAFCLQVGDERVSFRVNLDALARSGVKVHPGVLKLGRKGRAP
ncbi:hypothetical protein ATO46_00180 [Aeromonas schubertii]|nr:hypothetical protein ATO46_00180 [Aeromonas schubertii]QCG48380.1 YfiR family protein [Aeromonas schubertii]